MNQKDMEILLELKPLENLWAPLSDEKAVIYCKQLQPYDIGIIRRAVDKVSGKWDRMGFPPPAVIIEQCDLISRTRASNNGMASAGGDRLAQRDKAIADMKSEYLSQFMNGSIAADAKREGWDSQLRNYVLQVAGAQAQLIHANAERWFAICWHLVTPEGLSRDEHWKFQKDFIRAAAEQAAAGHIEVTIPQERVDAWKLQVYRARAAGEYQMQQMAEKYGASLGDALPAVDAPPPRWDDIPERTGF